MSKQAVDAFLDEVDEKIRYFRKEWNMNYAEILGCLRVVSRTLEDEMVSVDLDEDGEQDSWKNAT